MFPIRCFTCRKVIGNKYEEYKKLTKNLDYQDKNALLNIFNFMKINRMCCRRIFMTHVEIN